MKKLKTIFTILLFATIIYSCNNSTGIVVSDEEKAKFQAQIETFKTFTDGFLNEDIDLLMSVMADSVQWSPPNYNGNQLIDSDGLRAAGISYFEGFDGITFNEGDGLVGSDNGFWSGSLYSAGETNTDPSVMRVYGTWSMTHTETGAPVSNKWYGVLTFNEDGKIAVFSDWMDVNGMQVQVNNYVESNKQ
ncbi:MAG: nuclear transport factor 2 family protein [Flavobacteriales bacterium]|jgi:hypothetical protein|nr:MAG: nuclear transport factor 2 family protein [Flavobacteriales bacterium]